LGRAHLTVVKLPRSRSVTYPCSLPTPPCSFPRLPWLSFVGLAGAWTHRPAACLCSAFRAFRPLSSLSPHPHPLVRPVSLAYTHPFFVSCASRSAFPKAPPPPSSLPGAFERAHWVTRHRSGSLRLRFWGSHFFSTLAALLLESALFFPTRGSTSRVRTFFPP
jgi:hypothetical protein